MVTSSFSTFVKCVNKLLFLVLLFHTFSKCEGECELMQNSVDNSKEKELLSLIKPLNGLTFETKDVLSPEHYTYKIGICGGMENNVGAVQYGRNGTHILGLYNMTDVMGGTDWLLLTYYGGDTYGSHCTFESRRTKVMMVCDPNVYTGKLEVLEERKFQNQSDCYYLFELSSNVLCTQKDVKLPSKLSSGSVFCILFFTVISVYLICGFLYKRIVIGAKGLEQIPNYSFWRDFGNLQADGCDFFCRCGPRQESQAYRGIDDHLKEEERDDQLLNM